MELKSRIKKGRCKLLLFSSIIHIDIKIMISIIIIIRVRKDQSKWCVVNQERKCKINHS